MAKLDLGKVVGESGGGASLEIGEKVFLFGRNNISYVRPIGDKLAELQLYLFGEYWRTLDPNAYTVFPPSSVIPSALIPKDSVQLPASIITSTNPFVLHASPFMVLIDSSIRVYNHTSSDKIICYGAILRTIYPVR